MFTRLLSARRNVGSSKVFDNATNPTPPNESKTVLARERETFTLVIFTQNDPVEFNLPKFSPYELLGLSFLKETEDGTMIRAKVTNRIND
jgi:hypothetical protein